MKRVEERKKDEAQGITLEGGECVRERKKEMKKRKIVGQE